MESRLVPEEGFNIEYINVKGLKRKLSFDTDKNNSRAGKRISAVKKDNKEI